MKNLTGVIIGAVIVVLVIIGVLSYQKNSKVAQPATDNKSGGSLYIGVTDKSADIKNVNDVDLSVKKIEMHSATNGWITVSSSERKYALFSLKANGQVKLYIKKDNVPSGFYDKVRVTLGDVVVHTKTKGDIKATMPSSQIVMNVAVQVNDNKNTHIKLDFLADKSLHVTSDGKYVFAAVLKMESRSNADVTVASNDNVNVSGGTVDGDVNVGIDLDGSSRSNFELDTDNSFKIESDNGGEIKFMLGGKSFTSDDSKDREDEVDNNGTKINTKVDGSSNNSMKMENGSTSGSSKTNVNGNVNVSY